MADMTDMDDSIGSIHSPESKKSKTVTDDVEGVVLSDSSGKESLTLNTGHDNLVLLIEEFRLMRDTHATEFKAMKSEMLTQQNLREMVIEIVKSLSAETRREVKQEVVKEIKADVKEEVTSVVKKEMTKHATENKKMKEKLESCESKMSQIESEAARGVQMIESVRDRMNDKMQFFENKMLDLEARGRRNNLLFYGVKEEGSENCFSVVQDIIKNKLKITETIRIERAHRIGEKRGQHQRPLIVRFLDYSDKVVVKKERKYLPTDVSMSDDLPYPIRQAQKKLVPELKEAKESKFEAFIRFPATLYVNGQPVRHVDPLTMEMRDGPPLSAHPQATPAGREHNSGQGGQFGRSQPAEDGWRFQGRGRGRHGERGMFQGRGGNRV